jgi:plasmid stabilization system protein ParE
MSENPKFQLHPAAAQDITEIWQFIAEDNLAAAGRFREEILDAIRTLVKFPHQGHKRPISPHDPCVFKLFAITSSSTRRRKSHSSLSELFMDAAILASSQPPCAQENDLLAYYCESFTPIAL